ncbi:hypothetical protein SFC88_21030 [Nocardioides sp. HM23]|nr:hypothetical protein [Nocardioides sp. HM23]
MTTITYADLAQFSIDHRILDIHDAVSAYQDMHSISTMVITDAPDDCRDDDGGALTFCPEAVERYGIDYLAGLVRENGFDGIRNMYPELLTN